MISDYSLLVVQIAKETQMNLFEEVKTELSDWLKERERPGSAGRQRKSLPLLEEHVAAFRAGHYFKLDEIKSDILEKLN